MLTAPSALKDSGTALFACIAPHPSSINNNHVEKIDLVVGDYNSKFFEL